MDHMALLTPDLHAAAAELRRHGISPGEIAKAADGTSYFLFKDPMDWRSGSYRHAKGSRQAELRGKALGTRRVSDHLQHMGLPADHDTADMELYQQRAFQQLRDQGLPNGPKPNPGPKQTAGYSTCATRTDSGWRSWAKPFLWTNANSSIIHVV